MVEKKYEDKIGDYAIVPVPKYEQRGFLSNTWISAGWIINVIGLYAGAAIATGLTVKSMILVSFGGMAIVAVYAAAAGAISGKYHTTAAVTLRQAFGRHGAILTGGIIALVLGLGWYAFITSFLAMSVNAVLPGYWFTSIQVATVWGGLLMMVTAVIGYKGLGVLSFIAVPLVLLLVLFGFHATVLEAGSLGRIFEMIAPGEPISTGFAISAIAGSVMAGAIAIGDITRYAKSAKAGAAAAGIGYGLGGTIALVLGGMIAVVTQVEMTGVIPQIPGAMKVLGLGSGGLAILILAQWTTNDNNLYSGALGLVNIIPISKRAITIILGLLGTGIATFGIFGSFMDFMGGLGVLLPPIGGVLLCDYWIVHRLFLKKEYNFGPGTICAKLNIAALIAFVFGVIAAYRMTATGIPAMNGIITSFVLYAVIAIICEKANIKYKIGEYKISEVGY